MNTIYWRVMRDGRREMQRGLFTDLQTLSGARRRLRHLFPAWEDREARVTPFPGQGKDGA